jgi:hypothetical protein
VATSTSTSSTTVDPGTTTSTGTTGPEPLEPCGPPCAETFVHDGDLQVNTNDDLTQYACVTHIVGKLNLGGALDSAALAPFANLQVIEGEFAITSNSALTNLDAFACLREVDALRINNAPALTDMSGLANLKVAPHITVQQSGVTALPELAPTYQGLRYLRLWDNPALADVSAVAAWPGVGVIQEFEISKCPALTSVEGVGHLLAPAMGHASLRLQELHGLTSLHGLEPAIRGSLDLVDLPLVPDLLPLSSFAVDEPGSLWLSGMPLVTSLDGLNDATGLGHLEIGMCPIGPTGHGMDGLTSLAGLDSQQWLSILQVAGNANLASLSGATSLTKVENYLNVAANPKLSQQAFDAFLEQLDGGGGCFGDWDVCVCPDFMP